MRQARAPVRFSHLKPRRKPIGAGASPSGWLAPLDLASPTYNVPPFVLGTPSTWDFSGQAPFGSSNFRFDPNSTQPPSAFTIDSVNKRVAYSGGGTVGTYSGARLENIPALDADWQTRISSPGVVKYARLDTLAEIRAFQWEQNFGNDPLGNAPGAGNLRIATVGGINCMEIFHPVGGKDDMFWWWPLAPLTAPGNGKAVNDPADSGAVTLRPWSPTNGSTTTQDFGNGWYAHSSNVGTQFDGNEFWLQIRTSRDPARFNPPNDTVTDGGKFSYLSICHNSLSQQELVTYSGSRQFRVYGGVGSFIELGTNQPGGVAPLFQFAVDGTWDTIMYHIKPGRAGVNEALFEMYGAHQGETAFTLYWSQIYTPSGYDFQPGYQALILGVYNNGFTFNASWRERHREVILARGTNPIPCPQV